MVGTCNKPLGQEQFFVLPLNNMKKSPDFMLWFSCVFLTISELQEEHYGRTPTSQET